MKNHIITLTMLGVAVSVSLQAYEFTVLNHTNQARRVKMQLVGVDEPVEDLGIAKAGGGKLSKKFEGGFFGVRYVACLGRLEVENGKNMDRLPIFEVSPILLSNLLSAQDNPSVINNLLTTHKNDLDFRVYATDSSNGLCFDRRIVILQMRGNDGILKLIAVTTTV